MASQKSPYDCGRIESRSGGSGVRLGPGKIDREAGQVFVVFALALPVLLGFAALVVDLGNTYVQRQTVQQAADAAALAAVQELNFAPGTCDDPCQDALRPSVAPRPGDTARTMADLAFSSAAPPWPQPRHVLHLAVHGQ